MVDHPMSFLVLDAAHSSLLFNGEVVPQNTRLFLDHSDDILGALLVEFLVGEMCLAETLDGITDSVILSKKHTICNFLLRNVESAAVKCYTLAQRLVINLRISLI